MSIGAVLFLFSSVLPGILEMFVGEMEKLPLITRILKSTSDFFVTSWKTILVVLFTAIAVV